jgi:hypothetical protein
MLGFACGLASDAAFAQYSAWCVHILLRDVVDAAAVGLACQWRTI